jgi:hypothetical protein
VVTTNQAQINSVNANGNAIFGLIGLNAQGALTGVLAAGIDHSGNVFIVEEDKSIPQNVVPIGVDTSYNGGSVLLNFIIYSKGVEVTAPNFNSGTIRFSSKELDNFSLSAAFGTTAIPALVTASQPGTSGGAATFGSIRVISCRTGCRLMQLLMNGRLDPILCGLRDRNRGERFNGESVVASCQRLRSDRLPAARALCCAHHLGSSHRLRDYGLCQPTTDLLVRQQDRTGWRWFLPRGLRRVQQPDRALGMNARKRIHGMVADRTALSQMIHDGSVSVLGEHQNLRVSEGGTQTCGAHLAGPQSRRETGLLTKEGDSRCNAEALCLLANHGACAGLLRSGTHAQGRDTEVLALAGHRGGAAAQPLEPRSYCMDDQYRRPRLPP